MIYGLGWKYKDDRNIKKVIFPVSRSLLPSGEEREENKHRLLV
jgi:hypothetical protein